MHPSPSATVLCLPTWRSTQDCESLIDHVARGPFAPGRIALPDEDQPGTRDALRRCELSHHLPAGLVPALESELLALVRPVYGFELRGFASDDPVTVMRYPEGGHFAWHMDNALTASPFGTRKLSFTLQLSQPDDYDGGDLELAPWADSLQTHPDPRRRLVARQQGTLIVFPSFLSHRVTAVVRGTRMALVGWLHGPHFR